MEASRAIMFRNLMQTMLKNIRDWIDKMITPNNVKKALQIDVALSSAMVTALETWAKMYTNESDWLDDYVKSLNLAASISNEIAGNVTLEMKVDISGSERATYLAKQFEQVMASMQTVMEYGLAKGGLIFKPYVKGTELAVDYVQADQFYPISFDNNGNMTGCVFNDQRKIGEWFYTRLEYHNLVGKVYTVRNAAFRSRLKDDLGNEVALASVPDWADIEPEATIQPIDRPLFGYYKVPLANNVDTTSPLGVSCYSRAVDTIEQADKLYSDFIWEYYTARRAIDIDELAFDRDSNGKPVLPDKRLYRTYKNGDELDKTSLFREWSPSIREQNYINGLEALYKVIEYQVGVAEGSLPRPVVLKYATATEIKLTKSRFYKTITNNQKALKTALEALIYAMDVWATLENLTAKGSYQTLYTFDDSIVADHDTQFTQDSMSLAQKTMSRVEFRMRTYGETEEIARQKIAEIDQDSANRLDLFGLQQPGA